MRFSRELSETKYISSRTVCLKFAGQVLPKYVYFCRIRYEVYPFPKLRFTSPVTGLATSVKTVKVNRAIFFAMVTLIILEIFASARAPRCINCQGKHLATLHECPIVIKHKMFFLLHLITSDNILLIDARRKTARLLCSHENKI